MNKSVYLQAKEELRRNDGQWSAFQSKGNCVIMAGPGSGKTKTIILKMARLLEEEIRKPRRLACITYSNACVGEIRSRLADLGIEDSERLLLSTVHSFCLTELVIPYAGLAGIVFTDPVTVCSASQSNTFFRKACVQALGGVPNSQFRLECDRLRRNVLDRDGEEWKNSSTLEKEAIEAYESILTDQGMIDFDTIIYTGLSLVEKHEWIRKAILAKFPVIVIDEYQDLGLPLHRMVMSLMEAGLRIIAVGDPDQSIYGFTGANPALLKALEKSPNVQSIRLKLNYRCADQIISASKVFLTDPPDYRSHDGSQGEIRIYQTKVEVEEQALFALKSIVPEMLKQNPTWKPGDIAFLYPTLNEGTKIAKSADSLKLQYFRRDNGSPIKRSRLIDWLIEAAKWCSGDWKTGSVSLAQLLKSWRLMRRSYISDAKALEDRSTLISTLFRCRDDSLSLRKWLSILTAEVIKSALNEEPAMADEKDMIEGLLKATDKGGALQDFTIKVFGNQGRSPDQINLLTLHSSKGLEFQSVIMVGLEKNVFPNAFANTKQKQEEPKRLFYVGITRAKRLVHLLYNQDESPFIDMIRQVTKG